MKIDLKHALLPVDRKSHIGDPRSTSFSVILRQFSGHFRGVLLAGAAIKAVLSTSNSWPHTGGVRYAVAQGLPVYILDLNRPLLDKMMSAPHTLDPDALEKTKNTTHARWRIVAGKEVIGNGENRMELYLLRGSSTERQYMGYFPDSRLCMPATLWP